MTTAILSKDHPTYRPVSDELRLPIEPAVQTPKLILPRGVRSKH